MFFDLSQPEQPVASPASALHIVKARQADEPAYATRPVRPYSPSNVDKILARWATERSN